jgi:hypothetical protein
MTAVCTAAAMLCQGVQQQGMYHGQPRLLLNRLYRLTSAVAPAAGIWVFAAVCVAVR